MKRQSAKWQLDEMILHQAVDIRRRLGQGCLADWGRLSWDDLLVL